MKVLLLGVCAVITAMGTIAYLALDRAHEEERRVIVLLGPPGSGKGTQAKRVTTKLDIPHISTGDLFRENLSKGTELGKKVKSYMESGNLVPDEIVVGMLVDRVSQPDCRRGYLLDGFPRSLPQAEALERSLDGAAALQVISLDVPDELIVKRVEGRLSCSGCGAIYNRYFSPPEREGRCDRCGKALQQRSDDNGEVIVERLRVYHEQTAPLEKFYAAKGVVKSIDGSRSPDEVFQELMESIEN